MKGRFEDLEVWQEARALTNRVYDLTECPAFAKDYGLRDQIRRATVSILSNIAEGYERDSDAEFSRFLLIAKGSAGEVRAQLYIALDRGYIDEFAFAEAKRQTESVCRRVANFLVYLKRSQVQSRKSQDSSRKNLRHTTSDLSSATSNLRHVTCDLRPETCDL